MADYGKRWNPCGSKRSVFLSSASEEVASNEVSNAGGGVRGGGAKAGLRREFRVSFAWRIFFFASELGWV